MRNCYNSVTFHDKRDFYLMAEIPVLQETNQQLLHNIKNRFAVHNVGEAKNFNASNFTIPIMRTLPEAVPLPYNGLKSHDAYARTFPSNKPTESASTLNQFIMGQLSEKRSSGEIGSIGFTLPKLQLDDNHHVSDAPKINAKFIIPLLKNINRVEVPLHSTAPTKNMTKIKKAMENLNVCDDGKHAIDLTAALFSNGATPTPSKRFESRTQPIPEKSFDIPFIECDRKESPMQALLPNMDETCRLQMSSWDGAFGITITASCPIGDIWSHRAKLTRPLPYIEHDFEVKYLIEPFRFDIKSPDDIVMEKLNRSKRQYERL